MQIRKIQNNNTSFGAEVFIFDNHNIVQKGIKKTFTDMCKKLGKDTDEIFITVSKGDNKIGELETDIFSGIIRKGFMHSCYRYDYDLARRVISGRDYAKKSPFKEELPVWTSRDYSMPRNLAKIFNDYILPIFDEDVHNNNGLNEAQKKLLEAIG